MIRLQDYLDYEEIEIKTTDGQTFKGTPICVNYPDDTGYEGDEIVIENDRIIGIIENEIAKITITKE